MKEELWGGRELQGSGFGSGPEARLCGPVFPFSLCLGGFPPGGLPSSFLPHCNECNIDEMEIKNPPTESNLSMVSCTP